MGPVSIKGDVLIKEDGDNINDKLKPPLCGCGGEAHEKENYRSVVAPTHLRGRSESAFSPPWHGKMLAVG